jgi:chromate transporter
MVGAAMRDDSLLTLAAHFAFLSLFAIGGGMAVVPEFQRLAVETQGWMTNREFADLFAIAQVSPGPNILLVTLIGYHVAGLAGAAVTTAAMCGPTCLFAYALGRAWDRFREARWRIIIQAAMLPLSIGLLCASSLIVARAASQSLVAVGVIAFTAAVSYWTRLNPLWIFALSGVLGLVGLN